MAPSLSTLAVSASVVLFLTQWLWPLFKNYQKARASGVPMVISPVNPDNMLWRISQRLIRPQLRKISVTDGQKLSMHGWAFFPENNGLIRRHGNMVMNVTAGRNTLWIADPAVSLDILARRKAFIQSRLNSFIVGFMGRNVFTSNHEDWARQRRLVVPNFNERIMETVWTESIRQALAMVDCMLEEPDAISNRVVTSMHSVSMNVLAKAAYGHSKTFKPVETFNDPTAKFTYADAVWLCTTMIFYAALFPSWLLRHRFATIPMQTVGAARDMLPGLTRDMLTAERKAEAAGGNEPKNNLMSMLVRLSDSEKTGDSKTGLLDEEISGNLFAFTAAGFDTTANTLVYSLILLAVYPEWQDWVQEEVDFVWKSLKEEGKEEPSYADAYPRLTRVQALMYETLRLFPASLTVSRDLESPQTIKRGDKIYQLSATDRIFISIVELHNDPAVWGPDSLEFRPTRWLQSDGYSAEMITPPRGSFIPWGVGPRLCPGIKTSQVEFTTVMTTLMRKCQVSAVPRAGQTMEQARKHLYGVAMNSNQSLALQLLKPDDVYLKWERR